VWTVLAPATRELFPPDAKIGRAETIFVGYGADIEPAAKIEIFD
jgi:hypothetical protein